MKRVLAALASLLLAGVSVAACTPPKKGPPPPPPEEPSEVQISTDPELFPTFSTEIPDYVSRCSASSAVQVTVSASEGTTVSVDGQPPQSGDFTAAVTRDVGQSFAIVIQPPAEASSSHSVRCLPADFPAFTVERSGTPQAEWYVTAPIFGFLTGYPAVFDNNGVPVWWRLPSDTNTTFFTLLPDGNLAWTGQVDGGARVFELDGTPVHTVNTVGALDDSHDLLLLPNGNYVFVGGRFECCYDLTSWGGPMRATVLDHVIQELTPGGDVVWEWVTSDHINPVDETAVQWREGVIDAGGPHDVYHWNSVEPTSTGYVLSYRHLNAVYHIDRATGAIDWKLGGSPRDESLAVIGDPVFDGGSFAGQHDGRVLGDGTLTLFDNGTNAGRAPRVVRYELDEDARTATLLQELSDPLVTSAVCCGSTRMLPGGNWVTGWGGINPVVTEMTPFGERVFLLEFEEPGVFTYRATPVPPGELSREELRAGMDAQYPVPP